jgi:tetratricopeptide (TPR) repeat protein
MMATGAPSSTIALKPWLPDSPYARRLRAAAPEQMYAIYLDERPSHVDSTAFFLDAADIFSERGQPELALRIVSNLAEMDLENRHILRVLAFRLLQAKQVALALPLLRKVLLLSPEEPQSYRDLGLALAADGQYQAAVERLWDVVARPWNERFPDIEMVALAELNAVRAHAAASGVTLHLPQQDARLLRNLPLDLRAVMTWDADNTDIDLHVTDPNGEEAYYGRQLTYQGGRMSRDFTSGYGPEEFALRHAKPGTYTVQARFYGHRQQIVSSATTLMLRLTTGFGTPAQKDHDVVLRLSGQADRQVLVGSFEVGGPAANATGAPR